MYFVAVGKKIHVHRLNVIVFKINSQDVKLIKNIFDSLGIFVLLVYFVYEILKRLIGTVNNDFIRFFDQEFLWTNFLIQIHNDFCVFKFKMFEYLPFRLEITMKC